MTNFEKNVTADYLRKAAQQGKAVKDKSYELMQLDTALHILDVGCGPGLDTVPIAQLTADSAKIVGIDVSSDMLQQANEFAQQTGVAHKIEHVLGSVAQLPFASGSFDAVRAERLFQVLPSAEFNYRTVFAEIDRVVAPSGKLVLADTDWASASVNFEDIDLERKLMRFFADVCRPNGYAGRQFYGLMQQAGYLNIQVEVLPQTMFDIDQSPLGTWLIDEALKQEHCSKTEAECWLSTLRHLSACNQFFGMVNMVVVAGEKPVL